MKARRHLVAWLGLVLPTLAVGALALWLLAREQSRLDTAARESARARAQTVADNLDLIMAEIKTGVMEALEATSGPGDVQVRLRELVGANPFAAGYAMWEPDGTLISTDMQRAPAMRKRRAPQGDVSINADASGLQAFWQKAAAAPWVSSQTTLAFASPANTAMSTPSAVDVSERARPASTAAESLDMQAVPDNYASAKTSRQSIREISQQNVRALNTLKAQQAQSRAPVQVATLQSRATSSASIADTEMSEQPPARAEVADASLETASQRTRARLPIVAAATNTEESSLLVAAESVPENEAIPQEILTPTQSGWVTRPDGAPGWLAWYQRAQHSGVNGIVLDAESVLQQLAHAFPDDGSGWRLIAPNGQVVSGADSRRYSLSSAGVTESSETLPVGVELPGWTLAVPATTLGDGSGFMLLGGLLVAALCAATLGAGTLLLWQARRDAREAARKTTFVSNVSHELRTPLTTIRMYAEMLEEGRVADDAKRSRYLSTITGETQRLSRLVDNVLDFSRLEQGRKKYCRERGDVGELVTSVLDAQAPRLREAHVAVDWAQPAVPIQVVTDRDALGQVLLNLVDNALKYAATGKFLGLSVDTQDGQVCIVVSDRGPGIEARDRERVFRAFQRLDERLTSATPGSGLGLSICRALVRDLGGDISLASAKGEGCRFVITLPKEDA